MGFTETLRLVVQGDMSGAVSNVQSGTSKIDKSLTKSKATADKWAVGLTKAGAGMMALGGAALFGLMKMAKASEEANLSTLKLQNSLKANPRLAGENVKTYTDLATAIQNKTAADADDITAGIAVLAQGKLTAKQMKELIPLVVDLARKKGMDETAAFQLASKAAGGNALALKKQGIAVDENLAKTDAYKATLDALKNSVGGFAEEEGKTFAGSLERMKNQLGDLQEGVGVGAVEAFTSLFKVVGDGAGKLESISPGMQATVGKVATYTSVALLAAGATSTLVGQVIKARSNFSALASSLSGLGGLAKATLPLDIVVGSIFALDAAFDRLFPVDSTDLVKFENNLAHFAKSGNVAGEMARVLGKDMDKLSDAFNEIVDTSTMDNLSHAAEKIESVGGLFQGDKQDLEKAKNLIDDLDKSLASIAERNPEAAADALDRITATLKAQGVSTKDVRSQLDDYDKALTQLDTADATAGVDDLGGAMGDQREETKLAEDALKDYTDTLRGEFDPLFAMQDSLFEVTEAQHRLSEATGKQTESQDAYNKAVDRYGEGSKQALEAAAGLAEANQDVDEATLGASKSTVNLAVASETLRTKLEQQGYTGDALKKKLYDAAISMGFTKDQASRMAAGLDVATGAAKRLDRVDPKVHVSVDGIATTASQMQRLKDELNYINNKTFTARVVIAGTSVGATIPGGRIFQRGGKVPGPKGSPQMILAHGGETVVPTHDAAEMRRFAAKHSSLGDTGGGFMGQAAPARVVIDVTGGDDRFLSWLKNRIRVEGAGDVQVALGQRR